MTVKRPAVTHPYLFGIFPILFLYAQNAGEMRVRDLVGPLVIVVSVTVIAMIASTRVSGSAAKAGIAVSTLLLLFFSYGYVFHYLDEQLQTMRKHAFLMFGCLLVFAAVLRLLQGSGERATLVTPVLNVVAMVLVLVQLGTAGAVLWSRQDMWSPPEIQDSVQSLQNRPPDIFFILLDGYAREDVLADIYDLDNRSFLQNLEVNGFEVAHDSRAPYIQTLLSMAAIFNLDYLDGFASNLDVESYDRLGLSERIWQGRAIQFLESRGYSTLSFATGYAMTEFMDADRYLIPSGSVSEYSRLIIGTTPLQLIIDARSQADLHRDRIEHILQALPLLKGDDRPLFALAHIVSPHPPFVLGEEGDAGAGSEWFGMADGTHRIRDESGKKRYVELYRQQVPALNQLIEQMISELLERPKDQQPVIILASDHGPGSRLVWDSMEGTDLRERLGSLFALYLPGTEAQQDLPNPMTPVNTFRILFNRYLESDYPMLPARSYFSTWEEPYALTRVEEAEVELQTLPPAE